MPPRCAPCWRGTGCWRVAISVRTSWSTTRMAARLVELAGVEAGETVIEIGAGLGMLTRALAARAARVVAIEIDAGLVRALRAERLLPDNVELLHADALAVDLAALAGGGGPARLVGNLPYSVASPLLRRLLDLRGVLTDWSVMLQREVAARVLAAEGSRDYGSLAVLHALTVRVEKCAELAPGLLPSDAARSLELPAHHTARRRRGSPRASWPTSSGSCAPPSRSGARRSRTRCAARTSRRRARRGRSRICCAVSGSIPARAPRASRRSACSSSRARWPRRRAAPREARLGAERAARAALGARARGRTRGARAARGGRGTPRSGQRRVPRARRDLGSAGRVGRSRRARRGARAGAENPCGARSSRAATCRLPCARVLRGSPSRVDPGPAGPYSHQVSRGLARCDLHRDEKQTRTRCAPGRQGRRLPPPKQDARIQSQERFLDGPRRGRFRRLVASSRGHGRASGVLR